MKPQRPQRKHAVRKTPNRCGATAVEFVFVFPLILLFFIGSIAFTQAFMLRDTAQHAAYKGARRGMVWNATTDDVVEETQKFLHRLGIKGAKISTTPEVITNADTKIQVTVLIPMNQNAWVASPLMPKGFQPGASVTIRKIDF